MQKIELELDDIELAQLHAFSRLNNVSLEKAAAILVSRKLAESVNRVFDEMLINGQAPGKRVQ